ncbi:MAG: MarR family transcriptional regulator [Actinomycetes bacterium]
MAEQLPGTDGLLGHVVRLNVAVDRVLNEIVGASAISVSDYLVLGVVRRSPDSRSAPTAICDVLGRTTGGMSLTLDRLESAGLIRRLPDPGDRRRVVVEATDTGIDLAKQVNANLHAWEDSLGLSDAERTDLALAIGSLTAAIDAAPVPLVAPLD